MSDHDWQVPGGAPVPDPAAPAAAPAPSGPVPPPLPPVPSAAAPVTPNPPRAPEGAWTTGQAAPQSVPPGWTPPPQPGLLPLHPLGFGTLLWAPFRTLRRNPAAVFGSGLVVQLVSAIVAAAVVVPVFFLVFSRLETAQADDVDALTAGGVGLVIVAVLITLAVSVVVAAFLQGVMVVEVATGTLGERLRFGQLWRRAAPRIGALIGWTLLVGLVVLGAVGVLVAIVVAGATVSPEAGFAAGGLAVLLLLGLLVLGAWIGTKLALVPGVIVLERAGIGRAVGRSWRLTEGYFWRTFGTILLVSFILSTASQIVLTPITFAGTILATVLDPTGGQTFLVVYFVTQGVALLLSILIGAITTVVQAALIAVILIDLRMRKEGLDLELQRAVEARHAGTDWPDPYRVPDGVPTAASAPST